MFLPGDFASEVIAHFIGYFRIEPEEGRLRLDYDEFSRARDRVSHPHDDKPVASAPAPQSFDPDSEHASVRYAPKQQAEAHAESHVGSVHFQPIQVQMTAEYDVHTPYGGFGHGSSSAGWQPPLAEAPPPGSTVDLVSQVRLLSDDDTVVTGDAQSQLPELQPAADLAGIGALASGAMAISEWLAQSDPIASVAQIPQIIEDLSDQINAIKADIDSAPPAAEPGETATSATPTPAASAADLLTDTGSSAAAQTVSGSQEPQDQQTSQSTSAITTVHTGIPAPVLASPLDGLNLSGTTAHDTNYLAGDKPDAASYTYTPPAEATPAVPAAPVDQAPPTPADPDLSISHTVTVSVVDADPSSTPADPVLQVQTVDTTVGPVIDGTHMNGAETTHPLVLADSLPADLRPEVVSPVPPTDTTSGASLVIDGGSEPTTMTVEAGGNLSMNETQLVNAGVTSTFLGVAGDYHRIDAIVQTNAYADSDHVDGAFPGADTAVPSTTQAVNLATFTHQVVDAALPYATANPDLLPSTWQVNIVHGDMVFLDWISQYSFTSDNDRLVLTATGTNTTITTGENLGLDHVSFQNIGQHYDLMLIGGNLYDGNVISQTNVLYDNDSITTLGSTGSASGTLDTSGNLLWNQASITNVGATNWLQGLPQSYASALDSLSKGSTDMPDATKADQSFAGFAALRVLYVAGSVYDLHYVSQVNIVADSDQVALYQDKLNSDNPGAVWDVSTGGNALVNAASILDYDNFGSTAHYGGTMYSDAILVQADIVQGTEHDLAPKGDQLASEVVAFLHDDADNHTTAEDTHSTTPLHVDAPSLDVMHAVLA